jgi:hypothetical protein
MQINKYLWEPPKEECQFIRLPVNQLTFKNFWHWKPWKDLLTQQRQQHIMSRSNNKYILECTVYGTRECLINIQGINVKGIPTFHNKEACLYACKFINEEGNILAYTEVIESSKPNIDSNDIQSIELFNLYVNNEQQYILRENNYYTSSGFFNGTISPHPWIDIANSSGQDIMGSRYCSFASDIGNDWVYVLHYHNEMDLLLGILLYYVCEAELYRQPP